MNPNTLKLFFILIAASLLSACKTELYTGLSEKEANEMFAILANAGIDATRTRDEENTYQLSVDEDEFAISVEILSRLGYPEEQFSTFEDIYKGNRLVSSPTEERTRLSHVTNQQLSQTISDIEGVTRARVHLALPEVTLLGETEGKPTAAVTVHYVEGTDPSGLVPVIKRIVSHSVKDLNREDVTIAFFETPDLSAGQSLRSNPSSSSIGNLLWNTLLWIGAIILVLLGLRILLNESRATPRR